MWWSVILAVIGVAGLYLTTQKNVLGFAIGFSVQILWIIYAVVTGQYGFILSAVAYAVVNVIGLRKWTKDSEIEKAKDDGPNFLYFTGINPEYPPHYWELKTSYGLVVQRSMSYRDEMSAIRNAVQYFGETLFNPNVIVIDTSPDILAKVRRELANKLASERKACPFEELPGRRIHQYRPANWVTGD
ncbi:gp087 [Rhodococcus phage ReqiPoco6]|uniref:Gp087 n=1 Tax=Rhodococcus phage ReqiPoco6 TaxID=691964 RepID=D4P7V5_9CAUD|nr:gp087 [Rhodococcus phage ReqiPoco6]ADD81085.1 gp087 [Rhodococcus phage ReqiPoco6]